VLRFEDPEDLLQGAHLRALGEAERFEFRGERPFLAWIQQLIRNHLADRHDYWHAMKRGSGRVLRYTSSLGSGEAAFASLLPPSSRTGPVSFAMRREWMALAARALAVLPERDRELVRWASEGVALDEQARRLGTSYAVAQRAGLRAAERFRKAFHLVARASRNPAPSRGSRDS
jgi:DNA-directed RNA polymerase specialized sigma24 family protein